MICWNCDEKYILVSSHRILHYSDQTVRGVEVPRNQVDIKLTYLQYLSCTIYYNGGCAKTNTVSPKPWGCANNPQP